MKILLTGHRGFIGSHMLKLLSDKHSITTYDWDKSFPRVRGHDWIIHLGAITSTTENDLDRILTQNYDFTVRLVNDCIENNVNLQFASSASIYGPDCAYFTEDARPNPRNYYAISKYMVERYFNRLPLEVTERIRIQSFRYFNVCGTGQTHKGNMASPDFKFAKQYAETGRITLFENSQQYSRDFIPVEKICQTHIDFFNVNESGVWNLGLGKTSNFYQIARTIAPDDCIDYIPMPPELRESYQAYTCADISKITQSLSNIGIKF